MTSPTEEIKDLVERAKIMSAMLTMCEPISFGSDAAMIDELADALSRIAAERDALQTERTSLIETKRDQLAKLTARALAAEAERDRLREIVSRCAAALPNGAFVAPTASLEFMAQLPHEIELVCAALSSIKGRDG